MKNRTGLRLSRRLKTSKKNKYFLPLFSVVALVLAFFASTKAVYADGEYGEFQSWQYTTSDVIYTACDYDSNHNAYVLEGYEDIYVYLKERLYIPASGLYNRLDGSVWISDSFSLDCITSGYSKDHAECWKIQVIDYELMNTINDMTLLDTSNYTFTHIPASTSYGAGTNILYQRNIRLNFSNFINAGTNWLNLQSRVHLRAYYRQVNPNNTSMYAYHIFNHYSANYTVSILRNTSDYSFLNSINTNVGTIKNDVNSIKNNIVTDSSGTATSVNNTVNAYNTAEQQAETSINGALPNANTELNAIDSLDFQSVGNNALPSLNFWRNLGNFILDNANLYGIGILLIFILFINFVTYMLRM